MSYRRPISNNLLLLLLLGAIAGACYLALSLGSALLFSPTFQQRLVARAPSLEPTLADADRLTMVHRVMAHLAEGDPQQLGGLFLSSRDLRHLGEVRLVVADLLHLKRVSTLTFAVAVFGGLLLCWRELQSKSSWLGELALATGWMLITLAALTTSVMYLSSDGIATIRDYFFDSHRWLLSESSLLVRVFSRPIALELVRMYGAVLISAATMLLTTGYLMRYLASRPVKPARDWLPPPPRDLPRSTRHRRSTR